VRRPKGRPRGTTLKTARSHRLRPAVATWLGPHPLLRVKMKTKRRPTPCFTWRPDGGGVAISRKVRRRHLRAMVVWAGADQLVAMTGSTPVSAREDHAAAMTQEDRGTPIIAVLPSPERRQISLMGSDGHEKARCGPALALLGELRRLRIARSPARDADQRRRSPRRREDM